MRLLLIGCFQIRLKRITAATLNALTCFWISPAQGRGIRPRRNSPGYPLCVWSLTLILLSPSIASAQSELVTGAATAKEVYEKVAEAAAFLSRNGESGLNEFQKPHGRFVWKNTYVEVTKCKDNYCLPGPKSQDIGLNIARLKCYITGKFYILDLCPLAMNNPKGAWIEYWHPRAGYDQPQRRVSFMMPAANTDFQVVSSVYDDSTTLKELNKLLNPQE